MKLLSVQLAKSQWIFDVAEMNPRGRNIFVDLIPALIDRFNFKQFPQEGGDFKEGLKLGLGTFANSAGDAIQVGLTIFSDGLVADTTGSTKDSDEFLEQAVMLVLDLGYAYDPSMIRRRSYQSQLFVRFGGRLVSLNPKLEGFSKRISEAYGDGTEFGCAVLEFWPDQTRSYKPITFSFQKRSGDQFSDDRYWSQAGLSTDKHLELLGELEAILCRDQIGLEAPEAIG